MPWTPPPLPPEVEAILRGASDSASFGVGPRIARAIYPDEEKSQEVSAKENPWYQLLGGLIGGIPQGLGAARASAFAGPALANQVAAGVTSGAALGAAHGLGSGGDVNKEGAAGAALGAGGPLVSKLITKFATPKAPPLSGDDTRVPSRTTVTTHGPWTEKEAKLFENFLNPDYTPTGGYVEDFRPHDWQRDPNVIFQPMVLQSDERKIAMRPGANYKPPFSEKLDEMVHYDQTPDPFMRLGEWMGGAGKEPVEVTRAEIEKHGFKHPMEFSAEADPVMKQLRSQDQLDRSVAFNAKAEQQRQEEYLNSLRYNKDLKDRKAWIEQLSKAVKDIQHPPTEPRGSSKINPSWDQPSKPPKK